MAELDRGVGVRVSTLSLDVLEALLAEIIQGCLDVGVDGRLDVIEAVCQDNSADHRTDCSLACAWEHLQIRVK